MFCSIRRNGRGLGQMAHDELSPVGGTAALVAILTIMTILIAVLALVIVAVRAFGTALATSFSNMATELTNFSGSPGG